MSLWQRQKNFWNDVLWKPKNPHSLEQLKYQYQVLVRNPVVTENNRHLLVETFRCIAEILIWGDQNDSRVFDFFLEKNMQSFFLKTMTQNSSRYVCLQLLQTLSILFENIRNETSIYYLLSNNHVNSIIVLKLDFSDEEVLAYYVSFLKTLSFKLNSHTIHFFYNEHLRDFPLYTEAIKFFNHSEVMVRIAVRTLTLNVYKVGDPAMLEYIRNKTAVPYFSNLIWFIGNHVIELDECLFSQAHHLNRSRLEGLVAEHLDHLYYVNDIICLGIECLNEVVCDHLLNRLVIPLYVYSLTDHNMMPDGEETPHISSTISLFLLAQVFFIITHPPLITTLAYLIFTGDTTLSLPATLQHTAPGHRREGSHSSVRAFAPPEVSLTSPMKAGPLVAQPVSVVGEGGRRKRTGEGGEGGGEGSSTESQSHMREGMVVKQYYVDTVVDSQYVLIEASPPTGVTPEVPVLQEEPTREKASKAKSKVAKSPASHTLHHKIPITSTVFLDAVMGSLSVRTDDSRCLFSLCLLYAIMGNKGIHPKLLEAFSVRAPKVEPGCLQYNSELVSLLLSILDTATATSNSVRLVTLRLAMMLLQEVLSQQPLQDYHLALVESIHESAILQLRLFYKGPGDEIFLDMFEDEYNNEMAFRVKVPFLMQDASMLLPPTDTPLSGIEFTRRLPCGENERARKAMRVFFAVRRLCQELSHGEETELPLTMPSNSATVGEIVDLNNCDLVSCTVTSVEKSSHHFMVVTETEFLLVNPDTKKLGWGVVHFIAFLQDVDISLDPADNSAVYVTVHSPSAAQKRPVLSAKIQFEDHIRCVAARQCLQRSREHLRLAKMARIAKLLHLPVPEVPQASLQGIPMQRPTQLVEPSSMSLFQTPAISTSVLQRVFVPSYSPTSGSQEIEMTNLCHHPEPHCDQTTLSSSTSVCAAQSPHQWLLPENGHAVGSQGRESDGREEEERNTEEVCSGMTTSSGEHLPSEMEEVSEQFDADSGSEESSHAGGEAGQAGGETSQTGGTNTELPPLIF